MTVVALALSLTLLAYLAGIGLGSPLTIVLLRTGRGTLDPVARSRRLFWLRILPVGLGIFVALGLVLPSFLWLEPARTGERVGAGLALLAALSWIVVVAGLIRAALGLLATRRLVRGWAGEARPIRLPGIALPAFSLDERFPLVAIAGCFRPRLYVSSTVLQHCTSAELAAIVAHETGHLRRGDTWKRVLLRACPDLFALMPLGAEIERLWAEAAEQAADDHAAAAGGTCSLDLASALIRVARLAGSARPRALPLTTLYRGGGVAERVSRLLEPPSLAPLQGGSRPIHAGPLLLVVGGMLGPAAAALGVLHPVHRVLEAVVHLLS
jgi:Zn-dependent protease with chaperone function